jgi:hypothetical protein
MTKDCKEQFYRASFIILYNEPTVALLIDKLLYCSYMFRLYYVIFRELVVSTLQNYVSISIQPWWYSSKFHVCFLLWMFNIIKNTKIVLVIIKWLKLFCRYNSYEVLCGGRICSVWWYCHYVGPLCTEYIPGRHNIFYDFKDRPKKHMWNFELYHQDCIDILT